MTPPNPTRAICYLATGNNHKAEEFNRLGREMGLPFDIRSAEEVGGMPEIEETGSTFKENATLKAMGLVAGIGDLGSHYILADDSGLEVDCLGGAPGVYSARYAGQGASDSENNGKLLESMKMIEPARRLARFRCHLVLIMPGAKHLSVFGTCEGSIATAPDGSKGFGYDPVFIPMGETMTLGRLGSAVKDQISHRRKALEILQDKLSQLTI